MKEEKIKQLQREHQARRTVYGCPSPTEGNRKRLHAEARRLMLRSKGPSLTVVGKDGGQ